MPPPVIHVPPTSPGGTSPVSAFDRPQPVLVVGPVPLKVAFDPSGPGGEHEREAREEKGRRSRVAEVVAAVGQVMVASAGGGRTPNTDAVFQAATRGLSAVGPAGQAAATALGAVKATADAFAQRARELANYSPVLASAAARVDVNRLQRDIREAQQLGPQLAKLLEAQDRLEETVNRGLLPLKAAVVEGLALLVDKLGSTVTRSVTNATLDVFGWIFPELSGVLSWFKHNVPAGPAAGQDHLAGVLDELRRLPAALPIPLPKPPAGPLGVPVVGGVI